MSKIKLNVLANFAGKAWAALMGLAFIPVYIKFLGMEAFGLIGFFATLQALFRLLDFGMSATLNRELARYSTQPSQAQKMRDLVRTLEIIYWITAIIICICVIFIAPLIAEHWITASNLTTESIRQSAILLGFAIALQWPMGFYSGGLKGLQQQVLYNVLTSGLATFRGVGAVLVLWLHSPTIEAYFAWQVVVSLISTAMIATALWKSLPKTTFSARFDKKLLLSVWRFAGGITAITTVAIILKQMDKILLSKLLPLETFGYYMLANVIASTLYFLIGPINTALFPRFSQLVATNNIKTLTELYHRACQFMSVIILPAAIVIALFSFELVTLWTGDITIAENTHWLISILVIGTVLNGLMNLPYGLQLAYGWTQLAFYTNLAALVLLVPLLIIMVHYYSAIGAASVWLVLNGGYLIIGIQLMHRRLLKGEHWHWYREDVFLPLTVAFITAGLGRLILPSQNINALTFTYIVVISFVTLATTALLTPTTRLWIIDFIFRTNKSKSIIK